MRRAATTLLAALTTLAPDAIGRMPIQERDRPPLPTREAIAELPPDGGAEFNRLIFEASPYLLQHARNPVDWYAWGAAAFERARVEDKPIFLSIGYSTCHWCHVMERECFEDAEVAALLNRDFVCIKVDREERPDVDDVYMAVTQAMTSNGGWPMTVVLTPQREPFFATTYVPKTARGGRPGMMELAPELARAWRDDREAVLETARRATQWLRDRSTGAAAGSPEKGGVALDAELLARAERELAASYDERWGGFGTAPKFPAPHNLRFLLRRSYRTRDASSLDKAVATLRAMQRGGIWDQVGFGFHRYSTDAQWLVPHFEKMLYDQALLALAYVEAWQATGAVDLRRTASQIFTYVLRDLTAPQGGFYSAEDADSEGEEGRFYTWTLDELAGVLGAEDAALAAALWGAREDGNLSEPAGKRNVLHLPVALDAYAVQAGLDASELAHRAEGLRAKLFAARERRSRPFRDDKVLTDWNGLMIAALAYGGRALGEPFYVGAAARAAGFALANLRASDGKLFKSWRAGQTGGAAVHDDYAFLTWGLIELYEATGEARWLKAALELVEIEQTLFGDVERGGFFLAAEGARDLIARPKTFYDGAIPSGNSVSALNLVRLARLTGRTALEERAERTLRALAPEAARAPSAHTQAMIALDFSLGPSFELVVAGAPGAADVASALADLCSVFAPNKVVLIRPEGEAGDAICALAPYAREQRMRDGRVTFYLCREFACELPTHDVAKVVERLRGEKERK